MSPGYCRPKLSGLSPWLFLSVQYASLYLLLPPCNCLTQDRVLTKDRSLAIMMHWNYALRCHFWGKMSFYFTDASCCRTSWRWKILRAERWPPKVEAGMKVFSALVPWEWVRWLWDLVRVEGVDWREQRRQRRWGLQMPEKGWLCRDQMKTKRNQQSFLHCLLASKCFCGWPPARVY